MAEPALVFFSPPFSDGLPRVNTRVFFFPRPYPAGCPCMFSLGIFQRIFITKFKKKEKKAALCLCVSLLV
jgi:hypothetical protein